MRFSLLVLAAVAGLVSAQNIPACVNDCITSAATASGCGLSDAVCLCSGRPAGAGRPDFVTEAARCYVANCDEADIVAGAALGGQLCAAIGVSLSTPAAAASILSAATASGAIPAASSSAVITNSAAASSVISSIASSASAAPAASSSVPATTSPRTASQAPASPTVSTTTGAAHHIKAGAGVLGAVAVAMGLALVA